MIQKRSLIFLFFYRNKAQVKKKMPFFLNSAKNVFYRKKIRLQVSKSGVFVSKKVSDFFFFDRNKLQVNFFANFRKSAKNFFNRKKIRLQVSKSGVFAPEKVSLIFFFYRNKLQMKKKYQIVDNLRKTFLSGKKSDFNFQNRGFLWSKKVL